MLALDKTLSYIDADFADVARVYKSVSPLTVALAGIPPEVCEAYVCIIRKNDAVRLHLGLATGGNRIFIYSPESQPDTEPALAGVLKDALAFVEAMGFGMEELNLNYSPAMRDVVLRDIKVLRPPRSAQKPAAKKAAPVIITRKQGKAPAAAPSLDKIARSESSARQDLGHETAVPVTPEVDAEELAALRGELVRLTAEKAAAERAAGNLLAAARGELGQMKAERDDLAESLAEQQAVAARLNSDLESLRAEQTTAGTKQESALRGFRDRLAAQEVEIARLRDENAALEKARDTVADTLGKEQAAHIAAREEAGQREARLAEDRQAALDQLHQVSLARNELDAGQAEALERLAGELETARAELERVTAEKCSAEELAAQQTELARLAAAELSGLNAELATLATEKIKAEELAAGQAELARATAAELAALKDELEQTAEEKIRAEERSAEQEALARTAEAELTKLNAELSAVAAEKGSTEELAHAGDESAGRDEPAEMPDTVDAVVEETVAVQEPPAEKEAAPAVQDTSVALLKDELAALKAAQAASEKMLRELVALQQRTLEGLASAATSPAPAPAPGLQSPTVQTEPEHGGIGLEHDQTGRQPGGEVGSPPRVPEPEDRFAALMTMSQPPRNTGGAPRPDAGDFFGRDLSAAAAVDPVPQPLPPVEALPDEFPPDDALSYFGTDTPSSGFPADDTEESSFMLQPDMEEIGYNDPAELSTLYQSINVVRMVQGGETPQGSKGFIFAIKSGDSFRVYAAIFLLERERSFIYAPQNQPQSDDSLAAALRRALDFAEMTGFMMDETDLGMEPERLARILAKIPMLKQRSAG
jgi:hypothetical protein